MPNIVFNRLEVTGPPDELAAFVERARYQFETAYSPPDAWLFAASAAHPALTFDHEFVEECDRLGGRGRLRAGELERFESLEAADLDWVEFEEYD
jgi:hypothetical protein